MEKLCKTLKKYDKKNLKKEFPRADDSILTDLIYGPIATNLKMIGHERNMQLALKSSDSHIIFGERLSFLKETYH